MHERGLAQCTPRNHDATVTAAPLLGLSSGYVRRSADRFPRQGSRDPWRVHQSYLRDWRLTKRRGVEDEALELTRRPDRSGSGPGSARVDADPVGGPRA
jgi:monooxygenase